MLSLRYALCLVAVVSTTPSALAQELLVDPSFETGDIGGLFPTSYGEWSGDEADVVGATQGVVPSHGSRMLQFVYSGTFEPGAQVGCDIFQLVDIEDYRALVEEGVAVAVCSGFFNRIAGDDETDRLFRLSVRAYVGDPSDFLSIFNDYIAVERFSVDSDEDPATWEGASVVLPIPPETSFLGVLLEAREDVFNDESGAEFDGHFADQFSLEILGPVPARETSWGALKKSYR